jgi:putative transposase
MALYKNTYRIESARLQMYDYTQTGCYFVTLCAHRHQCVFGKVQGEEIHLIEIGKIAQRCWEEIPRHFPCVDLDAFVVMPNHIHGIIVIKDTGRDVQLNVSTKDALANIIPDVNTESSKKTHASISPRKGSLSIIIRTFKAAVTTLCRTNGYHNFKWQSRFYDHIIRDEKDLDNVRNYIIDNLLKWATDEENPGL